MVEAANNIDHALKILKDCEQAAILEQIGKQT
jgi:ribosomal protein S21